MRNFRSIVILFLIPASALARIGETKEECVARYGEAFYSYPTKPTVIFKKDGIVITASFFEGKCDHIIFDRPESESLTDEEVDLLLAANVKPWSKQVSPGVWKNGAGSIIAHLVDGTLIISTADRIQRENKSVEDDTRNRLKDF